MINIEGRPAVPNGVPAAVPTETIEWRKHSALVLEPEVSKVGWDEFLKAGDMIAAGEAATEAAIPQILSWLK